MASKDIRFSSNQGLQLRVEVFSATNHLNYENPAVGLPNGAPGQAFTLLIADARRSPGIQPSASGSFNPEGLRLLEYLPVRRFGGGSLGVRQFRKFLHARAPRSKVAPRHARSALQSP